MPNALVVPVTINNSWKTLRYGKFPMGIGAHIKFRVHQPINPKDYEYLTDLVEITEKLVKSNIQNED